MGWMVLPLRRYFDFSGRSGRMEFWMFFLLTALVYAAFAVWACEILVTIGRQGESPHAVSDTAGYLSPLLGALGIFVVVTFIPSIAVQVRRFHDQGLTGALVLLNLIPWVGTLIVLVFMCLEGSPGDNRYGPDPKQA